MPPHPNPTLIYAAPYTPHTLLQPGVHLAVVSRPLDLERAPLHGGALVRTLALSSDPYIVYRLRDPAVDMFCPPIRLGDPVDNAGVGRVVRSEDPSLKPGDYVVGYLNFSEYSVYPGSNTHAFKQPLRKVERPPPSVPVSAFLGPLGLPGHTGYSAYKTFIAPRAAEAKTMFVSTGAGAVGTFLIEWTKLHAPHLTIIASAGSEAKVAHMRRIGVDVPFNYKTEDTAAVLKAHGPVDIYFDNVGGATLDAALVNMRSYGLIIACGSISSSSGESSVKNWEQVFQRSLTVKGFTSYSGEVAGAMATFFEDVVPLVVAGKLTSREHRYYGIEAAGQALQDVHTGANTGKSLVIVAED